ncbi:MAG: hypothetical protein Q8R60_16640 [Mycobacteriales bacterium]|nr:hypothetical protein [Mycobacteriales bacterium]
MPRTPRRRTAAALVALGVVAAATAALSAPPGALPRPRPSSPTRP